jgi:hypothetical protein
MGGKAAIARLQAIKYLFILVTCTVFATGHASAKSLTLLCTGFAKSDWGAKDSAPHALSSNPGPTRLPFEAESTAIYVIDFTANKVTYGGDPLSDAAPASHDPHDVLTLISRPSTSRLIIFESSLPASHPPANKVTVTIDRNTGAYGRVEDFFGRG